jgi:hypothetical protein
MTGKCRKFKRFSRLCGTNPVITSIKTQAHFLHFLQLGCCISIFLRPLLYREEDASPEIRELKREVESKKAVLQKRRALFPKL